MEVNEFKRALAGERAQIGLWLALPSTESAEIVAGAGFDWVVVDGEHGPVDLSVLKHQLLALEAYATEPVVRVPSGLGGFGEAALKRCLDLGARTVLVPMVESADEAREVVGHCRYPVRGNRGVAPARAARWGRDTEYFARVDEEVCVLVQVETVRGLDALEDIAGVDGVDGVFIGPSDLSASLGLLGQPDGPEVRDRVEDALTRVRATGKAAGVLTREREAAERYLELGAAFVAVGSDAGLLVGATDRLRHDFS